MTRTLVLAFTLVAVPAAAQQSRAVDGSAPTWDAAAAAAYLDARMDLWFANGTELKTGDTQTACVSCHAALAYALSRPALRRVLHADTPAPQEARLLDETIRRVDTYGTHQVLYDFNERRQIESRGTEAVLNGVPANHAALRKGVRWLEANQRASPLPDVPGRAWLAHSLNYDREHGDEKGEPWRRLFMTDTATAFAILALAD